LRLRGAPPPAGAEGAERGAEALRGEDVPQFRLPGRTAPGRTPGNRSAEAAAVAAARALPPGHGAPAPGAGPGEAGGAAGPGDAGAALLLRPACVRAGRPPPLRRQSG